MPTVRSLDVRNLRWSDWKNLGGRTQELVVWPPGSTLHSPDLEWRLARAECSSPGPFSSFPGYDRLLVPLRSALFLRHADDAPPRRVRRGEVAIFAGEWTTTVELPEGPAPDLNLSCARGKWRGSLAWVPLGARRLLEELEQGHLVAHLVEGSLCARVTGEDEPMPLAAGDSLWVRDARAGDAIELSGEEEATTIVLARIAPAAGTLPG